MYKHVRLAHRCSIAQRSIYNTHTFVSRLAIGRREHTIRMMVFLSPMSPMSENRQVIRDPNMTEQCNAIIRRGPQSRAAGRATAGPQWSPSNSIV